VVTVVGGVFVKSPVSVHTEGFYKRESSLVYAALPSAKAAPASAAGQNDG
jgi:hypothetical protein